jgi:hypothetical protein
MANEKEGSSAEKINHMLEFLASLVNFKYDPKMDSLSYEIQLLSCMSSGVYLRGKSSKELQEILRILERDKNEFSDERDRLEFLKVSTYLRGWIGALEHLKERI